MSSSVDIIQFDFENLKGEIIEFKLKMSLDEYIFYKEQKLGRFEIRMNELCIKHFGVGWSSLEDHFILLFKAASEKRDSKQKKSINSLFTYFFAKQLTFRKKYEIQHELEPDEELVLKGRFLSKRFKKVWTGTYEVIKSQNENIGCIKKELEITKPVKKNMFLTNWKTVLASFIDKPWNTFSGRFYTSGSLRIFDKYDSPKKLCITDYTCFLALKSSLQSGLYVTTHEQEILMPVSTGIAAKMSFRKTGNYILEINNFKEQIYSMTNFSYDKEKEYEFEQKTLFHVSGYTNSEINLQIPNGYYFVGKNYILELEFIAAPILLNSPVISYMGIPDISSERLLDDEEKKRLEEDEDNWT